MVIGRLSITRVAAGLGVAWNTANDGVLEAGHRLLINDPAHLEGVHVIGVDEHVRSHTGRGPKCVRVIIDLTPIRTSTDPCRLLDMAPGRSKQVFKTWPATQLTEFRDKAEIVAMDRFTGFKTAAEELPAATAVMDRSTSWPCPGTCSISAANAYSRPRWDAGGVAGIRSTGSDGSYAGAGLLTSGQSARLQAVFVCDDHGEVEVTWGLYQRIVAAYRDPDRATGKRMMQAVIGSLAHRAPEALSELNTLGKTLKRRAADVLAFFEHPGSSNGPTETINGRLEHLRGTALGFRNLAHYITRSLLDTSGFRTALHPHLCRAQ